MVYLKCRRSLEWRSKSADWQYNELKTTFQELNIIQVRSPGCHWTTDGSVAFLVSPTACRSGAHIPLNTDRGVNF